MARDEQKEILFFNTPISESTQDVIGVDTYVKKLNYAIDSGAQMIAITAPFGSGKTSVIELLEKKRSERKWKQFWRGEKIVKVSMWSQLRENAGVSNDLHRSFVYQFSSQISHHRGTYIRRRLNPNYGLLKMHVNKIGYWFMFLVAAFALLLCWALGEFGEELLELLPELAEKESIIKTALIVIGGSLGLIIVTRAEVIFSSIKNGGKKREIESTEIIDLYRDEILKYKGAFKRLFNWGIVRTKHYIVVIEDLDRSSDAEAVICFLKELRKYYVPQKTTDKDKSMYNNQVTFIVNVKPEALLTEQQGKESLYAKLFDYVLALQTVNVDNYDAVLEGLLSEKRERIEELGLAGEGPLSDIPGMKWIIRERRLGIREIKERLNIAFSLYESLKLKFESKPIEFEKCAVVAYLTTAFEKEFYQTGDRAFEELVKLSYRNILTLDSCKEQLPGTSEDYSNAVKALIEAKLIDRSYRTYFYNYPKGSYLYSYEERQIINAVLYGEQVEGLEELARKLLAENSSVIQRAFRDLVQLGLSLPAVLFESETLYMEAFRQIGDEVFRYVESLDDSDETIAKNIEFIRKMLSYDRARILFGRDSAERLCRVWERTWSETAILQLRLMLCKEFPSEIMWYYDLFYGVHDVIREEEMKHLTPLVCLRLVNIEHEEFDVNTVANVLHRFILGRNVEEGESSRIEEFLQMAAEHFTREDMAPLYLEYMGKIKRIVPEFEGEVFEVLTEEETEEKLREKLFAEYQKLINALARELSEDTADFISSLDRYDGYTKEVAERMFQSRYYLDYVLLLLYQKERIPFWYPEVQTGLEKASEWLQERPEHLMKIRMQLYECPQDVIRRYTFLFTGEYPVLTQEELTTIQKYMENSDGLVMQLVPYELITEENYGMFAEYFNRRKQSNTVSFEILMYIAKLSEKVAKKLFYALDFDMVRYRFISAERKGMVKQALEKALGLATPKGQLEFMNATKYIDTMWELSMVEKLKSDETLRLQYIDAVNNAEKITKNTINTLCRFGTVYPMSTMVNQKFYEYKRYVQFILSEIAKTRAFKFAEGEMREELWTAYVTIFSSKENKWIRKLMSEDAEFVQMVINRKAYEGMGEEYRMQLTGAFQDSDSIRNVMGYGESFALKYYSAIAGFTDEEAAVAFVSVVEQSNKLLASKELYEHTYEKLRNARLKAKYTGARNKNGGEN